MISNVHAGDERAVSQRGLAILVYVSPLAVYVCCVCSMRIECARSDRELVKAMRSGALGSSATKLRLTMKIKYNLFASGVGHVKAMAG